MSYNITWQDSNVILSFESNVIYQDIYEADNIIYGDPRFDNMKYQIADFSKLEKFELTEEEVQIIAALDKSSSRWNNEIKLAVVTSDSYLIERIKPYIESMQDTNWSIKIFKNIFEAKKWCTD